MYITFMDKIIKNYFKILKKLILNGNIYISNP